MKKLGITVSVVLASVWLPLYAAEDVTGPINVQNPFYDTEIVESNRYSNTLGSYTLPNALENPREATIGRTINTTGSGYQRATYDTPNNRYRPNTTPSTKDTTFGKVNLATNSAQSIEVDGRTIMTGSAANLSMGTVVPAATIGENSTIAAATPEAVEEMKQATSYIESTYDRLAEDPMTMKGTTLPTKAFDVSSKFTKEEVRVFSTSYNDSIMKTTRVNADLNAALSKTRHNTDPGEIQKMSQSDFKPISNSGGVARTSGVSKNTLASFYAESGARVDKSKEFDANNRKFSLGVKQTGTTYQNKASEFRVGN